MFFCSVSICTQVPATLFHRRLLGFRLHSLKPMRTITPRPSQSGKRAVIMQVATDLAEGLEYIHHHCRRIQNWIKSSSVVVTEPSYNAKICHFGAVDLTREIPKDEEKIAEEEEKEGGSKGQDLVGELCSCRPPFTQGVEAIRHLDEDQMDHRLHGTRGDCRREDLT